MKDFRPAPDGVRLALSDIGHGYAGARVLDDVSLELAAGEVTCLLGPSGCGKSTLLRIAAGVERQEAGAVRGRAGASVSDARAARAARGPRHRADVPGLRALPAPRAWRGTSPSASAAPDRRGPSGSRRLLERVGLARARPRSIPHQLSGGEQQRVALARALAPRPPILLMDEPFSGLDNRLRDGIRDETLDILKEEGTAVLLVTHEPDEAMRMADRIALMREGGIVQEGAPYDIYNNPVDREAAQFFSDVNVIHGVVQDFADRHAVRAVPDAGAGRPGRRRDHRSGRST